MKNYWKHIDDFFGEKLGKYRETPPPDVWDDLDKRLDTLTPAPPKVNPSRWIWHAGMVSLIAVLGVSLVRKAMSSNGQSRTNAVATAAAPEAASTANAHTANTAANTQDIAGATATGAAQQAPATGSSNNAAPGGNTVATAQPLAAGTRNSVAAQGNHYGRNGSHTAYTGGNTGSRHSSGNSAANNNTTPNSFAATTGSTRAPGSGSDAMEGIARRTNTDAAAATPSLQSAIATPQATAPAKAKEQPVKKDSLQPKQTIKPEEQPLAKKKGPHRIEAGIKAGFEQGLANGAASKAVVSPYVQYKISPKLAIMLQPAAKYAQLPGRNVGNAQSYYKVNNDGTVTQHGPSDMSIQVNGSVIDTTYTTRYTYRQSHDSVVKSYRYGGSYMEYELPILLRYQIRPSVSVYGGVNMVISRTNSITEQVYTQQGIVRSVDTTLVTSSLPAPPPVHTVIGYSGTPLPEYNAPLYKSDAATRIGFGYMLGVSYQYSNRWLLDATMQQAPAGSPVPGGYYVSQPLTSPYFRLSVGYTLVK